MKPEPERDVDGVLVEPQEPLTSPHMPLSPLVLSLLSFLSVNSLGSTSRKLIVNTSPGLLDIDILKGTYLNLLDYIILYSDIKIQDTIWCILRDRDKDY